MSEHTALDALLQALGVTDPSSVSAALDALAHSGVDLSGLTPDDVARLLHDAGVGQSGRGAHAELTFGGGRWEGHDQWGNPVQQSPGSPPVDSATGKEVNPNNVTWKS